MLNRREKREAENKPISIFEFFLKEELEDQEYENKPLY